MIKGFMPVIDYKCKILVLGSMPGVESLRKQEYYGYSRNQFWKIMFGLFGQQQAEDYEKKKAFLLEKHIALWDVIESCDREGSSDSNIKNAKINDFQTLFEDYTNIRKIYFNGKTAEKLFNSFVSRNIQIQKFELFSLPSTSPANAIAYESKLEQWKILAEGL